MASYRVSYLERVPHDPPVLADPRALVTGGFRNTRYTETDWEEEVEARNERAAVTAFFENRNLRPEDVHLIGEDGEPKPLQGLEPYDPGRIYIWIEDGKLMEYEGLEEHTPGMVTCPLCNGAGEVDEDTEQQYLDEYGGDDIEEGREVGADLSGEDIDADVRG